MGWLCALSLGFLIFLFLVLQSAANNSRETRERQARREEAFQRAVMGNGLRAKAPTKVITVKHNVTTQKYRVNEYGEVFETR